jgi:hypothetical protein
MLGDALLDLGDEAIRGERLEQACCPATKVLEVAGAVDALLLGAQQFDEHPRLTSGEFVQRVAPGGQVDESQMLEQCVLRGWACTDRAEPAREVALPFTGRPAGDVTSGLELEHLAERPFWRPVRLVGVRRRHRSRSCPERGRAERYATREHRGVRQQRGVAYRGLAGAVGADQHAEASREADHEWLIVVGAAKAADTQATQIHGSSWDREETQTLVRSSSRSSRTSEAPAHGPCHRRQPAEAHAVRIGFASVSSARARAAAPLDPCPFGSDQPRWHLLLHRACEPTRASGSHELAHWGTSPRHRARTNQKCGPERHVCPVPTARDQARGLPSA